MVQSALYECNNTYDGQLVPGDWNEWSGPKLDNHVWIQLNFSAPHTIASMKIWWRCQGWAQLSSFNATFSDGSMQTVGHWYFLDHVITFSARFGVNCTTWSCNNFARHTVVCTSFCHANPVQVCIIVCLHQLTHYYVNKDHMCTKQFAPNSCCMITGACGCLCYNSVITYPHAQLFGKKQNIPD